MHQSSDETRVTVLSFAAQSTQDSDTSRDLNFDIRGSWTEAVAMERDPFIQYALFGLDLGKFVEPALYGKERVLIRKAHSTDQENLSVIGDSLYYQGERILIQGRWYLVIYVA